MPRGDGTGPMGMGPMTGRAAGYCAGYGIPGYVNPGYGSGFRGRGFGGGGRGWRNRFYATGLQGWRRFGQYGAPYAYGEPYQKPDPELEKQFLTEQAEQLQSELDGIRKRLSEIESADKAE
ncbi:MAG: DUF5320 domain-containing protein [Syntrophaceae bacterium]